MASDFYDRRPSERRTLLMRSRAEAQGLRAEIDSATWTLIPPCAHEFEDGTCRWCFCPETDADLPRSLALIDAEREADERWLAQALREQDTPDYLIP